MPCQAYSLTTVGLNPTLISCENIRIYHDCLVWAENSVPRVTVWQNWCQTVIPKDRVFYPHQTVMVDSFPCTPFQFLLLFVILNAKHSPTETQSIFFAVAVIIILPGGFHFIPNLTNLTYWVGCEVVLTHKNVLTIPEAKQANMNYFLS